MGKGDMVRLDISWLIKIIVKALALALGSKFLSVYYIIKNSYMSLCISKDPYGKTATTPISLAEKISYREFVK